MEDEPHPVYGLEALTPRCLAPSCKLETLITGDTIRESRSKKTVSLGRSLAFGFDHALVFWGTTYEPPKAVSENTFLSSLNSHQDRGFFVAKGGADGKWTLKDFISAPYANIVSVLPLRKAFASCSKDSFLVSALEHIEFAHVLDKTGKPGKDRFPGKRFATIDCLSPDRTLKNLVKISENRLYALGGVGLDAHSGALVTAAKEYNEEPYQSAGGGATAIPWNAQASNYVTVIESTKKTTRVKSRMRVVSGPAPFFQPTVIRSEPLELLALTEGRVLTHCTEKNKTEIACVEVEVGVPYITDFVYRKNHGLLVAGSSYGNPQKKVPASLTSFQVAQKGAVWKVLKSEPLVTDGHAFYGLVIDSGELGGAKGQNHLLFQDFRPRSRKANQIYRLALPENSPEVSSDRPVTGS